MGDRYYHGGKPGLRIGQYILPPSKTGAPSCSDYGAAEIHDVDKVYVTPEKAGALLWAAGHPSGVGAIYRVEPEGKLEYDPDCSTHGLSYTCSRARIIGRVRVKFKIIKRVRDKIIFGAA